MNMSNEHLATRTHEKMREVLMYPDAPGPAIHYYMIRGGSEQKNITVWEPGTVGVEYIKTYGHYHVGDLDETYWVLYGEGIILQQKLVEENGQPIPDRVAEFKAIKVKAGDSVYMPSGYGHLAVNTGKTYFVTADDSPVDFSLKPSAQADGSADHSSLTNDLGEISMPGHADYEMVKQMRGFAYYVIEKNGAPALVKNPLYKEAQKTDFGGMARVE